MTVTDKLAGSATGISNIKAITFVESFGQSSAYAEIEATAHTLEIGDSCDVAMGLSGTLATIITGGIVKSIDKRRPEQNYVIKVYDKLVQANDYFIASDDPEVPFTAANISAETLVQQLLALAGITGVAVDSTGFTFGVVKPVPINLVSAWDYVENICRITGFVCYVDSAGAVHFKQRKPYIVGGDISSHTFTTGNTGDIKSIAYSKSDEKLRNSVVVYGSPGIHATLTASSPYLPSGFKKTIVVAHELIDTNLSATRTAEVNLEMFNRLTETVNLEILGNVGIHARSIVDVSESYTGLAAGDLWVCYGAKHTVDRNGYSVTVALVR